MKLWSRVSVTLLACGALSVPAVGQEAAKRRLTYEEAFGFARDGGAEIPLARRQVLAELPRIVEWLDDERWIESRPDPEKPGRRRVFEVVAASGREILLRDEGTSEESPAEVELASDAPVHTTKDGRRWLFQRAGDLHEMEVATRRSRQLTTAEGRERNARYSPDGKWTAYTRGGDLYSYDLAAGRERQLTRDGAAAVYNGWSSWVYMEEILGRATRHRAFWWSPDSTRLAFMRFDDSPVPVFPIYHSGGQHGKLEEERYPKAGDPNPWVRVGVVAAAGGDVMWMDFEERADHYLAFPTWAPSGRRLSVQWLNRGQDTLRLYDCDPASGGKRQIHEERQPTWVDFYGELDYLRDGSFLVRSDAEGWAHLFLHAPDGRLRRRLTAGAWSVDEIEALDEKAGWVYFSARHGRSWDRHLLRVRLDGAGLEQLTADGGWHEISVSPSGKYFLDTASAIGEPPTRTLRRGNGSQVRVLAQGGGGRAAEIAWGRPELFTLPSGDGYDLPAYWVLPPDFDPARRYPVLVQIYGGPEAGTVRNAHPGLAAHYWAQRGVIVMSVDHRGSGHFGKRGVALMHRRFGHWEMHDLGAAARWLRERSFVDGERLGIAGHSYGGYATLMAMTHAAGHFNFGQAGAPVTDFKLYDTVYTERYMDTPQENPDGYRDGAVLTWIERYRGGLRLTHGTIDDNVHLQNSLQVVDWLTRHNRPFELTLYPGSRHRYRQRAHEARESHDFWARSLLGEKIVD